MKLLKFDSSPERIAPAYWTSSEWSTFGAAIVPLERISGQWLILSALLPDGLPGSERFYVLANMIDYDKVGYPVLLPIHLESFQETLIEFVQECCDSDVYGLIRFTYTACAHGINAVLECDFIDRSTGA